MSSASDFNPLEKVLPYIEGFISRRPSPEVLAQIRGRFDVLTSAVSESNLTYEAIKELYEKAKASMQNTVQNTDLVLSANGGVELTEEAKEVHANTTVETIPEQNNIAGATIDSSTPGNTDLNVDEIRQRLQLIQGSRVDDGAVPLTPDAYQRIADSQFGKAA